MFVALADSEIIGVIEIRDNNTISFLFVDKTFQGQGIGLDEITNKHIGKLAWK